MNGRPLTSLLTAAVVASVGMLAACERPDVVQRGYRGLAMHQIYRPGTLATAAELNAVPEPEASEPPDPEAPQIKEVFKNVQVLNDLTVLEFSRLMQAMSTWVSPEEGCDFCHNPKKLESDEKYTKVVARRMLEMTRRINTEWKSHVAGTGVTCWTCHRGQAVPSGDWFANPGPSIAGRMLGNRAGQNTPGLAVVGNSALPYDPLTAFLSGKGEVRVQATSALANGEYRSVKNAEATYGLMMYMSSSLGVNCNYCHNTRSMGPWEQSTPQRVTAWHGIRMVRELNTSYLTPLLSSFPAHRLNEAGDGPKVGCETCHKGAYKPLYGASMLKDYPELAGVMVDRPLPPTDAAAATAAEALGASNDKPPVSPVTILAPTR